MEQQFNPLARVKGGTPQKATNDLFKVVDDINNGEFREKLAAAKSKTEHAAAKEKKKEASEARHPQAKSEQATREKSSVEAKEGKSISPEEEMTTEEAHESNEEIQEHEQIEEAGDDVQLVKDEEAEVAEEPEHEDLLQEDSAEQESQEEAPAEEEVTDEIKLEEEAPEQEEEPQKSKALDAQEESLEDSDELLQQNRSSDSESIKGKEKAASHKGRTERVQQVQGVAKEHSQIEPKSIGDKNPSVQIEEGAEELLPKSQQEPSLREKAEQVRLREGSSSEQVESSTKLRPTDARTEQKLEKILVNLNQAAEQVKVQAPKLNKLSPQALSSVSKLNSPAVNKGTLASPYASLTSLPNTQQPQASEKASLIEKSSFTQQSLNDLKEKVTQQVRYHLKLAMRNGIGEVKMRLHPQFLGDVSVKMILGKDDISATFLVENQSVKEIMQRSLHTLEQTLAERGIEVEKIEIKVAQDELQHDSSKSNARKQQEEQETTRTWIQSFKKFGPEADEMGLEDESSHKDSNSEELNIIA